MLLDRFNQLCPMCGRKSRRMVVSKELTDRTSVESVRRTWNHGGTWPLDEPFLVWVYSYAVSLRCRLCGHQWTERVTQQRPW